MLGQYIEPIQHIGRRCAPPSPWCWFCTPRATPLLPHHVPPATHASTVVHLGARHAVNHGCTPAHPWPAPLPTPTCSETRMHTRTCSDQHRCRCSAVPSFVAWLPLALAGLALVQPCCDWLHACRMACIVVSVGSGELTNAWLRCLRTHGLNVVGSTICVRVAWTLLLATGNTKGIIQMLDQRRVEHIMSTLKTAVRL